MLMPPGWYEIERGEAGDRDAALAAVRRLQRTIHATSETDVGQVLQRRSPSVFNDWLQRRSWE